MQDIMIRIEESLRRKIIKLLVTPEITWEYNDHLYDRPHDFSLNCRADAISEPGEWPGPGAFGTA
jgi:hypothetical protein